MGAHRKAPTVLVAVNSNTCSPIGSVCADCGTLQKRDDAGCTFHRFTAQEARSCLSKRKLLLMGDSRIHFLYLALVNFLEYGEFALEPTWHGTMNPQVKQWWNDEAVMSHERHAQIWNDFLNQTESQLRGHEICDCYFEPVPPEGNPNFRRNRFYRVNTSTGLRLVSGAGAD